MGHNVTVDDGIMIDGVDISTLPGLISSEAITRAAADTANLNTTTTNLSNHTTATTAHGSVGNIIGQTTLNTAIDTRVAKSGDTMTGDLTMNANIVMQAGRTMDGVDVGSFATDTNSRLTTLEGRDTIPFTSVTGQIADTQVPQAMRPAAFGNVNWTCNYHCVAANDDIVHSGCDPTSICQWDYCAPTSLSGLALSNGSNMNRVTQSGLNVTLYFQTSIPQPYTCFGCGPNGTNGWTRQADSLLTLGCRDSQNYDLTPHTFDTSTNNQADIIIFKN